MIELTGNVTVCISGERTNVQGGIVAIQGTVGPYEFASKQDLRSLADTNDVHIAVSLKFAASLPHDGAHAAPEPGQTLVSPKFAPLTQFEIGLDRLPVSFSPLDEANAPFETTIRVKGEFQLVEH